jgi:hypothetical protein
MQSLVQMLSSSTGRGHASANRLLTTLLPALEVPHPQSAGIVAVLCC